ncbi:hypothetical protein SUGI_0234980 [Cryptomeria japonica]|uniref:uncharacterized protein LOC131074422 n=1 Tax=Cryptomeria japonica TaxID=3369 RepID=UPI002408C70F|nr:uncharacterized protein LOC131074422 [Cryptomeria japonica]GLJ14521.1 hypothetical protein SUGI_0234980 [Cryptomeria japonica]
MDFLQELPQQIFRDILLRVPYKSQAKIKELLEPAKEMIECSQFYQDRIKFGLTKKYICLLDHVAISIYDPVDQLSIMRTSIPDDFQVILVPRDSQIFCFKHKLVLWGVSKWCNISVILIYDLLSNTWKEGAQIPIAILGNGCCASPEGSIYIAGGYSTSFPCRISRKAAVYKVDEDEWELHSDMHQEVRSCFY